MSLRISPWLAVSLLTPALALADETPTVGSFKYPKGAHSVKAGDEFLVRGKHLDKATSISLDGVPLDVVEPSADGKTLKVIVRSGVSHGLSYLIVRNSAGFGRRTGTQVRFNRPPVISSVVPTELQPGGMLVVRGVNLSDFQTQKLATDDPSPATAWLAGRKKPLRVLYSSRAGKVMVCVLPSRIAVGNYELQVRNGGGQAAQGITVVSASSHEGSPQLTDVIRVGDDLLIVNGRALLRKTSGKIDPPTVTLRTGEARVVHATRRSLLVHLAQRRKSFGFLELANPAKSNEIAFQALDEAATSDIPTARDGYQGGILNGLSTLKD